MFLSIKRAAKVETFGMNVGHYDTYERSNWNNQYFEDGRRIGNEATRHFYLKPNAE